MHKREAVAPPRIALAEMVPLNRGLETQHAGVVVRVDEGGVKPRHSFYSISKLLDYQWRKKDVLNG